MSIESKETGKNNKISFPDKSAANEKLFKELGLTQIKKPLALKYDFNDKKPGNLQFQNNEVDRILDKWRHFSGTLGKRVRLNVSGSGNGLVGEALDIDSDGSLLVRQDSGLMRKVSAGDIIHCKR